MTRWRTLILALSLPLALLLLRLIWGAIAQNRLEREIALVRPEPVTEAELFSAADPDPANNAVPLLIDAMDIAKASSDAGIDSPSASNFTFTDTPPFPPGWHQLTDAALAADAKALTLARQARGRGKVFWTLPPGALSNPTHRATHLNDARNLANVLADAAMDAHDRGDNAEAFRRLRDTLFLARAVDRQGTFISHLVSIGISALATDRIMVIAPGVRSAPAGSPVRLEMTALIRELLDPAEESRGLHDSFFAERVDQIETVRRDTRAVWVTRPLFELDLARVLRADRTFLAAAAQSDWPAAHAMLLADPAMPDFAGRANRNAAPRLSRMMGDRMMSFVDRAVLTDMRLRTDRHFAATSLAIALWRADHNGNFPPSLAALVPAYVPAVPGDALASARRISYLTIAKGLPGNGGDRHLLYSVGENNRDDTASGAQPPPSGPEYGWNNTRAPLDDQHRDLDRWWPVQGPPASTQPLDQPTDRQ